ncbi:Aste57867_3122 [Aphanomyces stellatus]|uniref:Aste57867_3122 protein n=1 Tax=Aphanomyces stellatus TaxID=120398 RepID=A0A485KAP9_9STRA|nr:hypothetical protein As57867_003113 [Aphanomyces stellatus]VFT80298.1 Aste57867_3122 [Aphanomyces stellatus]
MFLAGSSFCEFSILESGGEWSMSTTPSAGPPPSPAETSWVLEMGEDRYEKMAKMVEKSLGTRFPQVEIRFVDLAITADVPVSTSSSDVPTLWTAFSQRWLNMCHKKATMKKEILKPHTGSFKPRSMTLVLGQPQSGKSSLMKILSGRFPISKNVHVDGRITYNGEDRADILPRLPQLIAYTNQRDAHYPTLTVEETFQFANDCAGKFGDKIARSLNKGTAAENEQAKAAVKTIFDNMPKFIMAEMGLSHCAKTIVGNGMLRGVSGGERKRVTTGEMKFGGKLVSLLDEISTGLDAASTYDIVKAHRHMAKHMHRTIVISLLQPPPEVLDLFDNILILNDGHVMYHGPRESVLAYFESLGFVCPPRRDVADFLLDLGTEQQKDYVSNAALLSPKNLMNNIWSAAAGAVAGTGTGKFQVPQTPAEFGAKFRESSIFKTMVAQVEGAHDAAHFNSNLLIETYHQTFWESTNTVMRRQFRLLVRNTAFIKGRFMMVLVMGLIYGTVFYQMNQGLPQVVLGLAFTSILFIAIGQAAQMPTFMEYRHVFYKQRGANFYRTASYVLSNSLAMVPFAIGESIVFGSIVYWMAGFASDISAFIFFLVILFLANLSFASWFFFLSSAAPNLLIAQPVSFISILIYVLFAGFIIIRPNIPDYFIWLYWINPLSWCFHALAVNQYRTSAFSHCTFNGIDFCKITNDPTMTFGRYSLEQYGLEPGFEWIIYAIVYLGALYLVFSSMSCFFLEFRRFESPEGTSIVVEEMPEETDDNYQLYPTTPRASSNGTEVVADAAAPQVAAVALTFQDLWYTVTTKEKEDIHLLKGITGYAYPGTTTALMGSSGAGKTTLLDVLAGRKTSGTIQGRVLLNGFPATPLAISRTTGYCEQMDNHCESATFREALEFSAFLRQSSDVSDEDKRKSVDEAIKLLDLYAIADKMIKGSSVEQMKRLTIGVELAAQASILFLDEPTSGLDARAAKRIMAGLKEIAKSGRTIVCTIHQPSSEVFNMFDNLLLMKRGGQMVFFGPLGPGSVNLQNYLEGIPGTKPLLPGFNPATWMLDVIGAGVAGATEGPVTDFAVAYENSAIKRQANQVITETSHEGAKEMTFKHKRAAAPRVQLAYVCDRFFKMYWRTPSYNLIRMQLYTFLAIFLGIVFCRSEYHSFGGVNGGIGVIFLSTLFVGIIGFNSVLPLLAAERASYYRERACQTYNALWYFVGSTLAEIPYVFLSTTLFTVIFYPFVGFKDFGAGVWYGVHLSLFVLMQVYFGELMICALPSLEVAAIMGSFLMSLFNLFMGFNPPGSQIPAGYQWLYTIVPPRHTMSILASIVFKCESPDDMGCQAMTNVSPQILRQFNVTHLSASEFVANMFDMKYEDRWNHMYFILGYIVLFRILALLCLRYVNHQKR